MMRVESQGNSGLGFFNPYIRTTFDSIQGHEELLNSADSILQIRERLETEHNLEFTKTQIKDNFSLTSKDNSPIVKLIATANTPNRAQASANTIADIYIQKITEIKRTDLNQGIAFLQRQMDSVSEKLASVEETLNKLKANNKPIVIPQMDSSSGLLSSGLVNKLQALEVELSKTRMEVDWTKSQSQSVQTSISEKVNVSSFTLPPQVERIQTKLVEMQMQLDSMRENFTEKDPKVVSAQREVEALNKRLDTELAKIRHNEQNNTYSLSELQSLMQQSVSLDVKLRGLKQKEALLKQRITIFKKEHPDLITEHMELTGLERQARVHEQTYMMLLDKYEEMSLLKEMKVSRLQIIDQAELPGAPISPKKKRTLIFGFMLGVGLGIGIAFFLEYLDDSIKLKEDVDKYLALPIIGAIPKIAPFKVPESALNERKTLGLNSSSKGPSFLLVSGENPQRRSEPTLSADGVNSPFGEERRVDPARSSVPFNQNILITTRHNRKDEDTLGIRLKEHRNGGKKNDKKQIKELLSHILLFADDRSPVVTNYRTLAANIRYSNVDTPIKTLLITSSTPSEGKTSTTTNLGISLAQMGKKVLLLDVDLRKRVIHRIFGQNSSPGLTEFLTDEDKSLEDYTLGEPFIRTTEVENLYIFPAGAYITNPEMLLSSDKMKELVGKLGEEYDITLLDTPPLLSTADAMTLAGDVDSTLIVIKSGETKRQMALQAKELLGNVNADILGVVLNYIDYSRQYGSYYYYYYRSYYYGGDKGED